MRPENRDPAYLWDMLDAAQQVAFVVDGKEAKDVLGDTVLLLALERGMEIIGEAARRVSTGFQDTHPEVPWRKLIGQRHLIAHEYGRIDHRQLFQTASVEIPALIAVLRQLLPPVGESEE